MPWQNVFWSPKSWLDFKIVQLCREQRRESVVVYCKLVILIIASGNQTKSTLYELSKKNVHYDLISAISTECYEH